MQHKVDVHELLVLHKCLQLTPFHFPGGWSEHHIWMEKWTNAQSGGLKIPTKKNRFIKKKLSKHPKKSLNVHINI